MCECYLAADIQSRSAGGKYLGINGVRTMGVDNRGQSTFFHEAIRTVRVDNRAQPLEYSANLRQLSQLSPELARALQFHQLHAAIFRAPVVRTVICDWRFLTISSCLQACALDAARNHGIDHALRAGLR